MAPHHREQWFSPLSTHQTYLEDWLKHGLGAPFPEFDLESLRWRLIVCLSNKFLGEGDGVGQGTTLGEPLP